MYNSLYILDIFIFICYNNEKHILETKEVSRGYEPV